MVQITLECDYYCIKESLALVSVSVVPIRSSVHRTSLKMMGKIAVAVAIFTVITQVAAVQEWPYYGYPYLPYVVERDVVIPEAYGYKGIGNKYHRATASASPYSSSSDAISNVYSDQQSFPLYPKPMIRLY